MSTHGGARREPSQRSEPSVPGIDASRFEFVEEIGSGGMGTVYKALQRSVGRYVAVKVLAAEQAANVIGLVRFVREANAIARIAHPNIVQLIDFGRDQLGRMLLVMELLEGESLRDLLRRTPVLSPERAVHVAVQCLGALRAAHAGGIVHRDLKPENVFVQRTGADDHVKVLDFGVAKIAQGDAAPAEHNTTQGTMVGTLRYMAPEQIAGESPDQRVDLYAMGVLLYEMLSGATPFDTRDRYVLLRQILTEEPTPLVLRAPHVPPQLSEVVMTALRKDASQRYASADDFRRALLPFLAGDHARLAELSESRGPIPARVPGAISEELRSGVVRTGSGHVALTSAQRPAALAPVAPPPSPAAPRRTGLLLGGGLVAVTLLAAGGLALSRQGSPAAAQGPALASATPAPVAAPAAPAVAPPPVATRMVLVDTTPRGARVLAEDGSVLCAETPCAVPVRVGESRPVRVVAGATALNAVLDGAQSHASLDLSALAAPPAPTPSPQPSPPRERPARRERARAGDEIPMLLPGGR